MKRPFSFGIIVASIFATVTVLGQRPHYRSFNAESIRPSPPSNLRIVAANGVPIKPVISYQSILDGLASKEEFVRNGAALELYKQKANHVYDIDLIAPFLSDNSNVVLEFVTSTLLDVLVVNPYKFRTVAAYKPRIRELLATSRDDYIKSNCIGLLSSISSTFQELEPIILSAIISGSTYEVQNSVTAIQLFSPASVDVFKALGVRLVDVRIKHLLPEFARAMSLIANTLKTTSETFYADRLEEGAAQLSPFPDAQQETTFIQEAAKQIRRNFADLASSRAHDREISRVTYLLHDSLGPELFTQSGITVNGASLSEISRSGPLSNSLSFLGPSPPFRDGLNWYERGRVKYFIWQEDTLLRRFENPYQNSHAIIVAIDNYRDGNPKSRGPKGYAYLTNMVHNANEFALELERNGFARSNIFSFFDEDAISTTIENRLKDFWSGGRYGASDRLVFYFGGHGNYIERPAQESEIPERIGFLVTFDHDQSQPTRTSLLMEDLTIRHFKNIAVKQLLVLLDSCSAGLALPQLQGQELSTNSLLKFKKYVVIDSEIKRPARNILVAGTGIQDALWVNGGIFTTALIAGLRGAADYNHDGLIEFDELALYTKQTVKIRAAMTGVNQEPIGFRTTAYAKGSVFFLSPIRGTE